MKRPVNRPINRPADGASKQPAGRSANGRAQRTDRTARGLAYSALQRIDHDGAYANLVLGPMLDGSELEQRDRGFATDLVYGTTRMRRACDFAVDRFVLKEPPPELRTLLRLGAYQIVFGDVAPHAAVNATVELAPQRSRGFINAILRRVAGSPPVWPNLATQLSYPDWIVERLNAELGVDDATAVLRVMNEPATVNTRMDGYVQDEASQWVGELVGAQAGERVVDLCAAPGGKATTLAASGATVIAADLQARRASLVAGNARRTGHDIPVVVSDARQPPFADASFTRVLLDAPCSGLGVLRRRADARWRIQAGDISELATLQQQMIDAAALLVRHDGFLVYSVCTLTAAESIEHTFPAGFRPLERPPSPWRPYGDGARLLPIDAGTDGMTILRYRRDA
jgi:16S rRNA (cytosine967-C5)-methyltransferase